MDDRLPRVLSAVSCLLVLAAAPDRLVAAQAPPPSAPAPTASALSLDTPPVLVVEAIVTDKKGAPAQNLRVMDFDVTAGGRRRLGLSIARLYRGPGAEAAAKAGQSVAGEAWPLTEPVRTVVFVFDQASYGPGEERTARAAAQSLAGLLALSDRVATLALPLRDSTKISFDRADLVPALAALRPLRAHGAAAAAADAESQAAGRAAAAADDLTSGDDREGNPRQGGGAPPMRDLLKPDDALSPGLLKSHALATLGALHRAMVGLTDLSGGKTMVLVTSGLVATDAGSELHQVIEDAARAQVRVIVLLVPSAASYGEAGARDLYLLARDTGGRLVPLRGKSQQSLEKLVGEMAFSYLLMLAPMAGDAGPAPRELSVTLKKKGDLIVQAPRLVAPGRLTREALAIALTPRAQARIAPPPNPMPAVPDPDEYTGPRESPIGKLALFKHDRSLDVLLSMVSIYAVEYGAALSSLVSEETYVQETAGRALVNGSTVAATTTARRTLVSDYLLVKIPGVKEWLPFRDVFDVDGARVRDRQDRLVRLFLEAPSPEVALRRANEVFEESARYNIGPVYRTLNVPTLPLYFVEPDNLRRFAFRKAGEEKILGRKAWVLEFTETVRPTFVQTRSRVDVPVLGKLWVDPVNGQICKTSITAMNSTITVTYAQRPEVAALLLPEKMEEHYPAGRAWITATATYSNYRQFRVHTSEQIQPPKK
jgi:hypothetical protein